MSEAKAKSGVSPLRIVLILVLLVMIGALIYDWYIAWPAAVAAKEKVETMATESASRPAPKEKPAVPVDERNDVHKALGKEPSDTQDGGHYWIEEYRWVRGLPIQSYFINVVYNKKRDGSFTLANVFEVNQEIEDGSLPGGPVEIVPPPAEVGGGAPAADPAQSEGLDSPPDDVSPPVDTDTTPPADAEATPPPADDDAPAEENAPEADAAAPADSDAVPAADEAPADDGSETPAATEEEVPDAVPGA